MSIYNFHIPLIIEYVAEDSFRQFIYFPAVKNGRMQIYTHARSWSELAHEIILGMAFTQTYHNGKYIDFFVTLKTEEPTLDMPQIIQTQLGASMLDVYKKAELYDPTIALYYDCLNQCAEIAATSAGEYSPVLYHGRYNAGIFKFRLTVTLFPETTPKKHYTVQHSKYIKTLI